MDEFLLQEESQQSESKSPESELWERLKRGSIQTDRGKNVIIQLKLELEHLGVYYNPPGTKLLPEVS